MEFHGKEFTDSYVNSLTPELKEFYMINIDKDVNILRQSKSVEQGSQEWLSLRKPLLTASNFSKVIGWSPYARERKSIVHEMCYGTFKGNAATRYGNSRESFACDQFEKEQRAKIWSAIVLARQDPERRKKIRYGGKDYLIPHGLLYGTRDWSDSKHLFKCVESGLAIHEVHKWMGASPDGILYLFDVAVGLLEIKCPRSGPYATMRSYYYGQLLGNCYMHKLDFIFFYVWSATAEQKVSIAKELKERTRVSKKTVVPPPPEKTFTTTDRVDFDADMWNNVMMPKMADFYFNYLLPELKAKNDALKV